MNAKCIQCSARCCRYFCVPLGMPASEEDLDTARWYLLHEGTSVFIDREGLWWVRVENRCKMLVDGESPGPRRAKSSRLNVVAAKTRLRQGYAGQAPQTTAPAADHGVPRCRDYRGRPLVCRRFSPKTCDYTLGGWNHAHLFRTAKDLDEYVRRIPRVGEHKRS